MGGVFWDMGGGGLLDVSGAPTDRAGQSRREA